MTQNPPGGPLCLGFAGTPEFAAAILQALLDGGRPPAVVYTQPDRPTGRGRRVQPPPVKTLAADHGLPVRQPASLKASGEAEALAQWRLDVLVVAAYGLLLPAAILAVPRLGCVNVHPSLLPRWRGAAPVERAIMAGDGETGVSIMHMDAGLDTGPVYLQRRCAITPEMDAPALEARLANLGGQALLECLGRLTDLVPEPQPDTGVSYARKLTPEDARIDWSRPARELERLVRALRARMPPFTQIAAAAPGSGGVRATVLEAGVMEAPGNHPPGTVVSATADGIAVACGEGALRITRLKLSIGKGRPLTARDAANGYPALFAAGTVLGRPPEPVAP